MNIKQSENYFVDVYIEPHKITIIQKFMKKDWSLQDWN